jgi:Outer membrane protein beta-barrel domain
VPLPALPISRSHFSPTSQTPGRLPRSQGARIPWGRFLLYGKGGGAWLRSDFSLQTAGAVFSVSETRSGWTVGVGGEYAFLDWLTGFIEYDHYGFRDDNGVSFGCGALCPIGTVSNQYQNRRRCREGRPEPEIRPQNGNARPVISRHPTCPPRLSRWVAGLGGSQPPTGALFTPRCEPFTAPRTRGGKIIAPAPETPNSRREHSEAPILTTIRAPPFFLSPTAIAAIARA